MRRIGLLTAALFAATLHASPHAQSLQTPALTDPPVSPQPQTQPPIFRGGTNRVRVYAIVLDDYHVQRMGELRVIEPLLAFVRQLPPTDLVAVFSPLGSVTGVAFSRDREPELRAIRACYGRRGEYVPPKYPVEEGHLRFLPRDIERIRREIVNSSLEGPATHLGGIKQGRKTVLFVSEGFAQPQMIRDSRAYYLIPYESPHPDDRRFHTVTCG